ncbi:peptidase inhibitor family I36 protein [Amycolatopsis suaedae]|uniref:Uncharacterized protein n=1 Tax=Amycolatopsis suaedae TaxID=2510978 RepID=A0A4Q7J9B0_9PSEU|nr:peptidase inhibitor family I36 protein [Amycolatopsis suaedae]RZQ63807.1 hypothetical protein EWH70_11625 [Amycolatopsis suaedae]
MKTLGKLAAVSLAVGATLALASPAQASDEASLPTVTLTIFDDSGKAEVLTSPDYARSSVSSVRAKAADRCPAEVICLFEMHNAGGYGNGFRTSNPRSGVDDFTTIPVPEGGTRPYGPGRFGTSWNFNDHMSSWVNNSPYVWHWYFGSHGTYEWHPMERFGGEVVVNLPDHENDHASSIYNYR